jgi:tetratricopeptide (TPR) repeat protein
MVSGRSLRKELDGLRVSMRRDGRTWREIALLIRQRQHVNGRVAFRLAHGWTQDDVAKLYTARWPDDGPKNGKHISYWENWELGVPPSASSRTPSYETLDHLAQLYECSIADLLGAADYGDRDANAATKSSAPLISGRSPAQDGHVDPSGASREEADPTKRRNLLGLGLAATVAPELLQRVLRDAAAEAMEFTRLTSVSSVGKGTLDHLEAIVTDLDRSYATAPAADLFPVARAYRMRVAQLIGGRHTLREGRELYVYAAWLDDALSWLAYDLGDPRAAEAYAIDCFQHADQAGHDELCAWASDAMNAIATYTNRHAAAVSAARRGITRVSPRHPLAVRLRAKAARAYAWTGRREDCYQLFNQAETLHDRLPSQAPMRLTIDTGTLAAYAMTANHSSACNRLGDFDDAKKHALAALAVHESDMGSSRSPRRETLARIDLAIALAGTEELDEALEHGRRALASPQISDEWVRPHAAGLDKVMMTRYPGSSEAREFRERYRELSRTGR